MKTKENLSALRNEAKAVNSKRAELSDEKLEQVVGGNITVNVSVPANGSAADLMMQLLEARPQLVQSRDELMNIAAQMDRDGKKRAILEFDSNNRLICVSTG